MSYEHREKLLRLFNDAGYQVHKDELEDVHFDGENYVFISLDTNDDTYLIQRWFTKARDFGASNVHENIATYEEAEKLFYALITKIHVVFDPIQGDAIRDGDVHKFVDDAIIALSDPKLTEPLVYTVANENTVQAFRLAVNKGKLDHNRIQFMFEGKVLQHDQKCQILRWPAGFCDTLVNILEQLK